ncbi:membrane hypothetical protein [Tenacibaculum sp. 190524A02b]|uniref:Uncharacterized protein n=1 Tax=Tenacibaculum vairaonense TaxID=3137860 RepID=A0ABM9PIR9_9FLAO
MNNRFHKKSVAEDVRLYAAILKWIEWLTDEYITPLLGILKTKDFEKFKKFEKPKQEKFQKNGLFQANVIDTVFLLLAVVCALFTEILLSQIIFEKVIGISPEKAKYMSWGTTAILFTGSMLIKPVVKDFLCKKPTVPRFFKVGMFTCCCVMFIMGGLSFYNIQKKNYRNDILLLSQRIEELQEESEENQEELVALEAKMKTKIEKVDTTPEYILGSSFLALSLLSLVMLFCSSFLKAVTVLYVQVLWLKFSRDYYYMRIEKQYALYTSLVSRLENAYGLRAPYLRLVGRKVVIESLQAANPVTSEYLKAINTTPSKTPNGLSTHHQTFTP